MQKAASPRCSQSAGRMPGERPRQGALARRAGVDTTFSAMSTQVAASQRQVELACAELNMMPAKEDEGSDRRAEYTSLKKAFQSARVPCVDANNVRASFSGGLEEGRDV